MASLVTDRHRAAKSFFNTLAPIVQARLQQKVGGGWTKPVIQMHNEGCQ